MARSWEQISWEMKARRDARGPHLAQMLAVKERYNGDWVLPDLGGDTSPLTPSIIADGVDNNGLRAASVTPDIIAPALRAHIETSRARAGSRRSAWMHTWEQSELNLHLRRAYRHLFGYATCVLMVDPDFDRGCPKIVVRDPLHCFPEPKGSEDLSPPRDAGFIFGKSAAWVRHNYPDKAPDWVKPGRYSSDLWDIIEWIDEDSIVTGILGPRELGAYNTDRDMPSVELRRVPNRTGRCTVVTGQRLTLDSVHSQVAKIIGHADMMARLQYLDILATQKSIMPDRYILGTSAMIPRLVGNTWRGGETGEVNVILDATGVGDLRGTPDPNNKITMDRIERNARVSTGQTPIMQGEAFGAARTGRGIDTILAAAVDPRIQEAQEIMQARLTDVNRIVGDCYLGYWAGRKYTVFSGWSATPEMVEFDPGDAFAETTENKVAYPLPGTDITTLNVALGQMVGTEMLDLDSARIMHPFIKDAAAVSRKVLVQKLEAAQQQQLMAQAMDPASNLTIIDMARITELVSRGEQFHVAVQTAQREAQERQAAEAPPAPEGMALPPELMSGMENPGTGAEMAAPIPEPMAGLSNFDAVMGALNSPVPR